MHQPYPKYKYHRELKPVVVHSVEEEEALEGDWKDSPAHHVEEPEAASEQGAEQDGDESLGAQAPETLTKSTKSAKAKKSK